MNTKTLGIVFATTLSFGLAAPATALACGGEAGAKGDAHFQRKDTNQDGFLTEAEVGAERWQRLKPADSNKDDKISKDELHAAFKAGKIGRHHDKHET